MPSSAVDQVVSASVQSFRLLSHPYYRAWQNGELQRSDLKSYAEQYRHFERCLPEALACAATEMTPGPARQLVEANLQDERSNPRPHLELFEGFGTAVGAAGDVDPTEATAALVDLYEEAAELGPVQLLAVVAGYETQAADVAATKADALTRHYGLGGAGTEFWTVHAAAEKEHAAWTAQALTLLNAGLEDVSYWSNRSARAWWQFLDEREASRAA